MQGMWNRLGDMPKIPAFILLLTVLAAIAAPVLTPHDPIRADLSARSSPPVFMDGGSAEYPLGTDRQGRDILTRTVWGSRSSLTVALLAVTLAALVGTTLGLVAGYAGGVLEAALMMAVDVVLSIPTILLALVLAVTIGPSLWVVTGILAMFLWAQHARMVRGEVLSIKESSFVALARVAGASPKRIVLHHVLPNVVNSIIVLATLQMGWTIVVEASLSFLGAGIPPPSPTWGGMVTEGRQFLRTEWWMSIFPGLAIVIVVLSLNMFGDWIRDALDPKLRQL